MWDYSGNRKRYRADIKKEFGVNPEQFADYLGLVGDGVDCITGVPGVGPVKAKELLRNFTSMNGIYENLHAVADLSLRGATGLASKLEAHQVEARLSRELATIICDANDRHEGFAHAIPESLEVADIDFSSFEKFLSNYKFTKNDSAHLLSVAEQFSNE